MNYSLPISSMRPLLLLGASLFFRSFSVSPYAVAAATDNYIRLSGLRPTPCHTPSLSVRVARLPPSFPRR